MTGTSVDAVDICLVDFFEAEKTQMNLIEFDEIKIKHNLRKIILELSSKPVDIKDISSVNFALSEIYYNAVSQFCKKFKINISEVDAIAIHGQTFWHQPETVQFLNMNISSTLQLGNGSALAKKTNCKVISDFRSGDIALGGQGAPLVPIFDLNFLFKNKNTIALNIGGIANITYIPKSGNSSDVIAFDTGPGNMLIDIMTFELFNKNYDENGDIASSGNVIPEMYNELMDLEYLRKSPPKSTGRELFNYNLVSKYTKKDYKHNDIIRTLTEFTASSIAMNIRLLNSENADLIISGGGVKNKFLVDLLNKKLPDFNIFTSDELGIPSDAKEAMCFAYLGYRTLNGLPGNLPSVTGASRETILGSISLP